LLFCFFDCGEFNFKEQKGKPFTEHSTQR